MARVYYDTVMGAGIIDHGIAAVKYAMTANGVAFGLCKVGLDAITGIVEAMFLPPLAALSNPIPFLPQAIGLATGSLNNALTFGLYSSWLHGTPAAVVAPAMAAGQGGGPTGATTEFGYGTGGPNR